jgi:hypothetical protein
MDVGNWIALGALVLFWLGTLITLYIKINMKMAEIDMKIKNTSDDLAAHKKWGLTIQKFNEDKFAELQKTSKEEHKELNGKLDIVIQTLNDFKLEVEKRIKD